MEGKIVGKIFGKDGELVPKINVKAELVSGEKQSIVFSANSISDQHGNYAIEYKLDKAPVSPFGLRVVAQKTTTSSVLATSPLIISPSSIEKVNLVISNGQFTSRSEYIVVDELVKPHLPSDGSMVVSPATKALLSKSRDIPTKAIDAYINALKASENHNNLEVDVLYALYRNGSGDSIELIDRKSDELKDLVDKAINRNQISPKTDEKIKESLEKIKDRSIENATDSANSAIKDSLAIFDLANIDDGAKKHLVNLSNETAGNSKEFWERLDKSNVVSASQREALKSASEYHALSLNHITLTKALVSEAAILSPNDLAEWNHTEWQEFLTSNSVTAPEFIDGKTESERTENYSIMLDRSVQEAYPTLKLAHQLLNVDARMKEAGNFLLSKPDLDFEKTNVSKYLEDENVFVGVPDDDPMRVQLTKNLNALQTLYHITPRYNKHQAVEVLWQVKLTEPHRIASMPVEKFTEKYAAKVGGKKRANFIHANARKVNQLSLITLLKYGHDQRSPGPYAMPATDLQDEAQVVSNATLNSIFGSLDFCQCRHCRSILSPAAYFVDLLLFLKDTTIDGTSDSGLDILFKRRPDLGNLELSCENTLTVIPHIDLVNEILENAISPRTYTAVPGAGTGIQSYSATVPQTTESRPDVQQAIAEHINAEAYESLRDLNNVYPWSVPYSLWQDEAQTYLQHIKAPRHVLMRQFHQSAGAVSEVDIAAVFFGMSVAEKQLVVSSSSAATLSQRWGVSDWSILDSATDLLRQADIEFVELLELLAIQSLQDGFGNKIVLEFTPSDSCAVSDAKLVTSVGASPAEGWFDKLQRFLRTKKRLGIDLALLDRCMALAGTDAVDDNLLVVLHGVHEVSEKLKLPLSVALGFYEHTLSTHLYHNDSNSIYEKLILNATLGALTSETKDVLKLNSARSEINDTSKQLTDISYSQLLRSVAKFDDEDLSAVVDRLLGGSAALNLASLSLVVRVGLFCDAAKLSVTEYLRISRGLRSAAVREQGVGADPWGTVRFLEYVDLLKRTGASQSDLSYICFDEVDLLREHYSDQEALETRDAILAAMSEIGAEVPANSSDEVTPRFDALLSAISSQFDLTITVTSALLTATSNPVDDTQTARSLFILDEPDDAAKQAQTQLVRRLHKAALLLNMVSDEESQLIACQASGLGEWPDLNNIPLNAPGGEPEEIFASELYKAALAYISISETLSAFSADEKRWYKFFKLAKDNANSDDVVLNDLVSLTRWDRAEIDVLVGRFSILRDDMKGAEWIKRLAKSFEYSVRIGSSVSTILQWTDVDVEFAQAAQIRAAVKSKFDEAQWLKVAPDLRDPIRQRQRDALLGYVLHHGLPADPLLARSASNLVEFENADELFLHQLIDTKIQPCLDTSRVKQAISSVQMFVQQIILGIDGDGIEISAADAKQWKWRKNYRVWEANRKVFLFPENWIYPELRDNKSDLFKKLEEELSQTDLNRDTASYAFQNYLHGLNKIAFLEPAGLCEHIDQETEQHIRHIFARSRSHPHHYYYRRQVDKKYWTPWESVELDIEGDHLLPVVYRGRLFLFWPKFLELSKELTPDDVSVNPNTGAEITANLPVQYYDIQMAWSEYRNGLWDEMKLTTEAIPSESRVVTPIPKNEFYFYSNVENGSLIVDYRLLESTGGSNFVNIPAQRSNFSIFVFNDVTNSLDVRDRFLLTLLMAWENEPGAYSWPKGSAGLIKAPYSHTYNNFTIKTDNPNRMELLSDISWSFSTNVNGNNSTAVDYIVQNSYQSQILLNNADYDFMLMLPHQYPAYTGQGPCFYTDSHRTFFVESRVVTISETVPSPLPDHGIIKDIPVYTENPYPYPDVDPIDPADPVFPVPRNDWVGPPELINPVRDDWSYSEIDGVVYTGNDSADLVIDRDIDRANGLRAGDIRDIGNRIGPGDNINIGTGRGISNRIRDIDVRDGRIRDVGGLIRPGADVSERFSDRLNPVSLSTAKKNAFKDLGFKQDIGYYKGEHSSLYLDDQSVKFAGNVRIRKERRYKFEAFYHPFVSMMLRQLNRYGVDGLFSPVQTDSGSDGDKLKRQRFEFEYFQSLYDPTSDVDKPYPVDEFDFSFAGSYSHYNWEVFFHAPLLIAERLMRNRRFEEARDWLHYIFDPTEKSDDEAAPRRFWKLKPFFEYQDKYSIQSFIEALNAGDPEAEAQLAAIERDPFNPHGLARIRIVAYMRRTVMTYIDNLIAWGDHLYRRDTMESVNEAAQLYVLAAQILGPKPVQIEKPDIPVRTFNELIPTLDEMGNAISGFQSSIAASTTPVTTGGQPVAHDTSVDTLLYFCVPNNESMLDYWETVGKRLYNIRHCLNIDGVRRSLALFEPPIDPAMLVKAAANGLSLDAVLSSLSADRPHYRFRFMIQKTNEFCSELRSIGSSLQSSMERKDAEELAELRSAHQVAVLDTVRELKLNAVQDSRQAIEIISSRKNIAAIRSSYYAQRISGDSILSDIEIPGLPIPALSINDAELVGLGLSAAGIYFQAGGVAAQIIAGVLSAIPNFQGGGSGFGGTPHVTVVTGGQALGKVVEIAASGLQGTAGVLSSSAALANTIGGYVRRHEDWQLQLDLANAELEDQLEQELVAAEIKLDTAVKDLHSHDLQRINADQEAEFLSSRFTNSELYEWLSGKLLTLHNATYDMTYSLAKQTEKCFQSELGDLSASFIKGNYKNGAYKGLLSGDILQKDLRRMESAYLEGNSRTFEISKYISLAQLQPQALLALRQSGTCEFVVPEVLFDMDYPGHYYRRIKNIALTIPCVVGSYGNLPVTLTLLDSRVRISTAVDGGYPFNLNDDRFASDQGQFHNQSVAISRAQNDSGLFEVNFSDERYLPFEGAGAISLWKLDLPTSFKSFDYESISDVIMQIQYTSRAEEGSFKDTVVDSVQDGLEKISEFAAQTEAPIKRILSANHEFSTSWHQFFYPPNPSASHRLEFKVEKRHFPHLFSDRELEVNKIAFVLSTESTIELSGPVAVSIEKDGVDIGGSLTIVPNGFDDHPAVLVVVAETITLQDIEYSLVIPDSSLASLPPGMLTSNNGATEISPDAFKDIYLVVDYTVGDIAT